MINQTADLLVLLVENNDLDFLNIEGAIQGRPFQLVRFNLAEDALIYLSENSVDLVVSEHRLTGISGLDFCQRIIASGISAPTVLLTDSGGELLATKAIQAGVTEYVTKDPAERYLELLPLIFKCAYERHQQKLKQSTLEKQVALQALVVENMTEGVLITDANNKIELINPAFSEITGYVFDEVKGEDPALLSANIQEPLFFEYVWDDIKYKGFWKGLIFNRRKDGEVFPAWVMISSINNAQKKAQNYICFFSDISSHSRKMQELVSHYAYYDSLTGLPNPSLFEERLSGAISRSQRSKTKVVLISLDLDRLQSINETHGHGIGDALLMRISKSLLNLLRGTDTVVRVSGDKFMLLLPDMVQAQDAVLVADNVLKELNKEMCIDSHHLNLSASMGIAVYPDDTSKSTELKRLANVALFQSKQEGGNRYLFYAETMNFQFQQHALIKKELTEALTKHQFELLFQPVIDIDSQQTQVLESLLRWRHPYRGVLLPHQFLSEAAEAGVMSDISRWVINHVCKLLAEPSNKTRLPKISINLGAYEFNSMLLIDYIVDQVKQYSIEPGRLVLELQEHLLLADEEASVQKKLSKLHDAGCSLWADDFSQAPLDLNRFILHHYDAVKMDMKDIENNKTKKYSECIDATVKMLKGLNIPVIHKNIETLVQLDLIKQSGSAWAQGFYFAKPCALGGYV